MRPTLVLVLALVGFQLGCGSSTEVAVEAAPEPKLSYAEWQKIADPEEKFNPHTVRRLPKRDRDKAAKLATTVK